MVYSLLEYPWVYRLAQVTLAPGTAIFLERLLADLADLDDHRPWLDVGCGPDPYVSAPAGGLVAIDLNPRYVHTLRDNACLGVVGDASSLPFPDDHFGVVWTFGLLHHLPDAMAESSLLEMLRVSRPDGWIHVIDAVLPETWWRRPQAHAIRRLDRGRHMRTERALTTLLPNAANWRIERRTYTYNGLELLICTGQCLNPL